MANVKQSVKLFFQDPAINSDKVYELTFEQKGSTYTVFAFYGRRNGHQALTVKAKTSDQGEAVKVYQQTLISKLRKGYQYAFAA